MQATILKSTLISSAASLVWAMAPYIALAQAKCFANGKEVPCEELANKFKAFAGLGIAVVIVFLVLVVLATVFWLMMIMHAAKHPIENKALWIVIMVVTGIVGALIYYFVVKRKFVAPAVQSPAP